MADGKRTRSSERFVALVDRGPDEAILVVQQVDATRSLRFVERVLRRSPDDRWKSDEEAFIDEPRARARQRESRRQRWQRNRKHPIQRLAKNYRSQSEASRSVREIMLSMILEDIASADIEHDHEYLTALFRQAAQHRIDRYGSTWALGVEELRSGGPKGRIQAEMIEVTREALARLPSGPRTNPASCGAAVPAPAPLDFADRAEPIVLAVMSHFPQYCDMTTTWLPDEAAEELGYDIERLERRLRRTHRTEQDVLRFADDAQIHKLICQALRTCGVPKTVADGFFGQLAVQRSREHKQKRQARRADGET